MSTISCVILQYLQERSRGTSTKQTRCFDILQKDKDTIDVCYIDDAVKPDVLDEIRQLHPRQKVMITNCGVNPKNRCVNVTWKSELFSTVADFEVNNDIVHEYFTPPEVSIHDALKSPPKRRLSISGSVSYVENYNEGPSPRKLKITDVTGVEHIHLKMWHNKQMVINPNATIQVQNVEVNEYNGIKSVQTTEETTITQEDIIDEIKIVVIGINSSKIYTQAKVYSHAIDQWKQKMGERLPQEVRAKFVNGKVMDVKIENTKVKENQATKDGVDETKK